MATTSSFSESSSIKQWVLEARAYIKQSYQDLKDKVGGKLSNCQYCEFNIKKGGKKKTASHPHPLFPEIAEFRYLFCEKECHMAYLKDLRNTQQFYKCLMPNCTKQRYCDRNRGLLDYCGRNHAKVHEELMKIAWDDQHLYTATTSNISTRQSSSKMNSQKILFYNKHDPYYEFTNFADYPVEIDNVQYPTTEHYFQSQKLIGTPYCAQVVSLPYARQAFEYPRQPEVREWVRSDWERVKEDIMYRGLYHKFTQHQYLFLLLINTRDAILVEDSPHDSYWGNGADGRGKNRLGHLLMDLRTFLLMQLSPEMAQQSTPERTIPPISLPVPIEEVNTGGTVSHVSIEKVNSSHMPTEETLPQAPVDKTTGELCSGDASSLDNNHPNRQDVALGGNANDTNNLLYISESTNNANNDITTGGTLNDLEREKDTHSESAMEVEPQQETLNTPIDPNISTQQRLQIAILCSGDNNIIALGPTYSSIQPSPSFSSSSEEDMETLI